MQEVEQYTHMLGREESNLAEYNSVKTLGLELLMVGNFPNPNG